MAHFARRLRRSSCPEGEGQSNVEGCRQDEEGQHGKPQSRLGSQDRSRSLRSSPSLQRNTHVLRWPAGLFSKIAVVADPAANDALKELSEAKQELEQSWKVILNAGSTQSQIVTQELKSLAGNARSRLLVFLLAFSRAWLYLKFTTKEDSHPCCGETLLTPCQEFAQGCVKAVASRIIFSTPEEVAIAGVFSRRSLSLHNARWLGGKGLAWRCLLQGLQRCA